MKTRIFGLALDLGFEVLDGLIPLECRTFNFSGGEPHIKITPPDVAATINDVVVISSRYKSFQDLGLIALAVDAVRRLGFTRVVLVLPYLPAARQDRVMVKGESLSLKVVTDFINGLDLNEVVIWDAHSDVAPALLNNVENIQNYSFVSRVIADIQIKTRPDNTPLIISPDAGSNKKIYALCEYLNIDTDKYLVKCDKHRNVENGKIDFVEVYADDLKGQDCVIVDDICDGGYTFLLAAKALKEKNAGKLYLAVTHGIFSKGFDELNKHFDVIYTTNSFDGERDVKVVELDFM